MSKKLTITIDLKPHELAEPTQSIECWDWRKISLTALLFLAFACSLTIWLWPSAQASEKVQQTPTAELLAAEPTAPEQTSTAPTTELTTPASEGPTADEPISEEPLPANQLPKPQLEVSSKAPQALATTESEPAAATLEASTEEPATSQTSVTAEVMEQPADTAEAIEAEALATISEASEASIKPAPAEGSIEPEKEALVEAPIAKPQQAALVEAEQQSPADIQALPPQLARAQLTSGIAKREPLDDIEQITLTEQAHIYLFLDVMELAGEQLEVRWLQQQQTRATYRLNIGGPRWRTNASKQFTAAMKGDWQVEVWHQQQLLWTKQFSVN